MGCPRTERPQGLPVSVLVLRRDGQRLTGDKFRAAKPVVGRLLLGPAERHRTGGGAPHVADLIKPGAVVLGSACAPLFNPVIERADECGFVLSGYEIVLEDGRPAHVEQVWLLRGRRRLTLSQADNHRRGDHKAQVITTV